MSRLAVVLSALAVVAVPTLVRAEPNSTPQYDDGSEHPSGGARGYIKAPPSSFVDTAAHGGLPGISKIIYINRCTGGCTLTKSTSNDAITNQTYIGAVPQGQTMTLSEFSYSQQIFDDTVACVREVYSPYDIQVVTEDPGTVTHHEAILAGRGSEMGLTGVLGVAPLDSSNCEPKNNVISFSFANDHAPDPIAMCWTLAQESAHSYGLDHEFDCSDPLTYLDGCGQKFFRNKQINCGTFSAVACICGGTTQNSHAKLLAVHGKGVDPAPPTVTIASPMNNATVQPGFSIFTNVIDRRGVLHIDLLINGWKWGEIPGVFGKTSAYTINVPPGVPDGVMDIDIKGCNDLEVCATQRVTVTRGAACAGPESCAAGQKCEAGRCFWDPPTGAIGDACTFNEACLSNVCADVGGGVLNCTERCQAGPNDQCPDGFECNSAIGQQGVCAAPAEETGCCAVGGGGTSNAVAVNLGLGALVGLVAIRRRRRRKSA